MSILSPLALLGLGLGAPGTHAPSPPPVQPIPAPAEPTFESAGSNFELARFVGPQDEETVPAVEEEEPAWTGSVALGAIVSSGNTERRALNASANAELRREDDRITWSALLNFSEEKNPGASSFTKTEERISTRGQYDYFFEEKTYLLAQVSLDKDELADLDLRYTVGAGIGRQFIEDEDLKVSGEAGLSYLNESFGNSAADTDYLALRLAWTVDWILNDRWSLGHRGMVFPAIEDVSDVYAQLNSFADVTLTERMFARAQWIWDWDNTPAPGLERSDHRVQLSLGWSF